MTELTADPLPYDPLTLADEWLTSAMTARAVPNPNAMALASVSADGQPSVRIVLCKYLVADPGFVVFFTNYRSRKGQELLASQRASAVLHFDHLGRQVRIDGPIVKSPEAESDAYFASRPWQSRIGARASQQSAPLADRARLIADVQSDAATLGCADPTDRAADDAGVDIPRPDYWGGFRLWAESVELWCDGDARLHDRARWQRELSADSAGGFTAGDWSSQRLYP